MTDDLLKFLTDRLDEDEATAQAVAKPHEWFQGSDVDDDWVNDEILCRWPPEFDTPYRGVAKHWRGVDIDESEACAHIARWDPARVLAEVAAKRKLVDRYLELAANAKERGVIGDVVEEYQGSVLPALALPYADHPSYREEWRP